MCWYYRSSGGSTGILNYNLVKTLADLNGTSLTEVLNERILTNK